MAPSASLNLGQNKENFKTQASSNYHEAFEKRKKDVIPMTFFIHEDEFMDVKASPKYDISVPGALYYERIKVFNLLEKIKKFRYIRTNLILQNIERIESLLKTDFNRNKWVIKVRTYLFRNLINNSFVSFTDGSQFAYPVRKFFEIPAFGSLLFAVPFYNHEKLGFKDGVNFIAASSDNIIEKLEYFLQHKAKALEIIVHSRRLIKETHSFEAWKANFSKIWSAIKADDFYGIEWEDGDLKFMDKEVIKEEKE